MMGKSVFEGYWLDDRVGEGAFGTVYRIVKQDETGTYTRALKEITIPTDAQYQEVLSSMGGDRRRTDQYFEEVWKNTKNEIRILNTLTEKGVKNIVFYYESFNRFLIISLDVLICRYSPLLRAFPALFISEEPHKSFYYPSCFRSQK